MAIAINQTRVNGVSVLNATLLDGVTGTTDGEWIDINGLTSFTVHTTGISGDTVKINGSNAAARPANNTHGEELASDQADDASSFTAEYKWIKARVSVFSAGTITVIINGHFGH